MTEVVNSYPLVNQTHFTVSACEPFDLQVETVENKNCISAVVPEAAVIPSERNYSSEVRNSK